MTTRWMPARSASFALPTNSSTSLMLALLPGESTSISATMRWPLVWRLVSVRRRPGSDLERLFRYAHELIHIAHARLVARREHLDQRDDAMAAGMANRQRPAKARRRWCKSKCAADTGWNFCDGHCGP